MSWVMSNRNRRATKATLLAFASMGWAAWTHAQDHTADPYKPYNQQYEQFVYPTYPSGIGLTPNQGVLEGQGGLRRANQFQRFLDLEEDRGDELSPMRRRTGPGIPYYSAYRQYDREYDRIYQANRKSDEAFYQEKRARHDKYLAYLKERDPRRRAELYREYTSEARRATRELEARRQGSTRRAPASGASATEARRRGSAPDRSNLSSGTRARDAANSAQPKPSEVLRENEAYDTPKRARRLTAPGLAPSTRAPESR